jgi:hypothetical protein
LPTHGEPLDADFGIPSRSDREREAMRIQAESDQKPDDSTPLDFVSRHVSDAFGTPTSASNPQT